MREKSLGFNPTPHLINRFGTMYQTEGPVLCLLLNIENLLRPFFTHFMIAVLWGEIRGSINEFPS
jgi:hypothetical protein